MLEQFLGLWIDKNNNVLLIKSLKANTVKVSFASGKTNSPVERCLMPQQLTIDINGEYDIDSKELIIQFGVRYFEPKLHLRFETTDIHNGQTSLKPSYDLSISTPKEKKEWMKWFEPLEDYLLIDEVNRIEEIKLFYKI